MTLSQFEACVKEEAKHCKMKRVILHWTGGSYRASGLDRLHYHALVEGDGEIVQGEHRIRANASTHNGYAAHTRNLNTGSIGLSVCGMAGATERKPKNTPFPITEGQMDALHNMAAICCRHFDIDYLDVVHHGRVDEIYGVSQRGKWDINFLSFVSGSTQGFTWSDVAEKIESQGNPVQWVTIRFDLDGRTLKGFLSNSQSWIPVRPALELIGSDAKIIAVKHDQVRLHIPGHRNKFFLPFESLELEIVEGTGFVKVRDFARLFSLGVIWQNGEVRINA